MRLVQDVGLIDYVNSQPLTNPLVCLRDGHEDKCFDIQIAELATTTLVIENFRKIKTIERVEVIRFQL
jgi:hypothetical protein